MRNCCKFSSPLLNGERVGRDTPFALTGHLSRRDAPRAFVLTIRDHEHNGRVFHTMLGHDTEAFEGVGFIFTFLRGTEWAATGKVTQKLPTHFPSAEKPSARPFKLKETK